MRAVGAALGFRVDADEESVQMSRLLGELSPADFVTEVTGLAEDDRLFADVTAVVSSTERA
jgi:mannitol-1-phosphate 5-dehydrogenase